MRILSILASPAPGGAEVLVRNLCTEFVRLGHQAHILFMSDAAGVGNPRSFEEETLQALSSASVTYEFMDRKCFRNPVRSAISLRGSVRRFRPDVLHTHLARGALSRSLSGLRIPTIYTHHNVVANFPAALFKLFDRSIDHYVAIGDACAAFLARHSRGRIVQIPNGVPASFSSGEPRRTMKQVPTVLAVGALTPKKDYANLIDAAAIAIPRFREAGRTVRFQIAGEGPERPSLEARINAKDLAGQVELLGARGDVAELMKKADLLVNSSLHEGLPITLIEAAMSGLPAVATDVGGNSEVVLDQTSGFIVPPAHPQRLADRIVELLSDEQMHQSFSRAALLHARGFTISACAEAHLVLYQSLLAAE